MSRMKFGNVIIWLLVFAVGFLAGTAWTNRDSSGSQEEIKPRDVAPVKLISNTEEATILLFEDAAPSVVYITSIDVRRDYWTRNIMEIPAGTGSGFVWDKDGHIVTNYHVIRSGEKAQVTLFDQSNWDATVVGYAAEKDLAILKIEAPADVLVPIAVGSSNDLRVGQFVYAIGNPFGLDQTLTTGVVSALGREIESLARIPIRDVIQTDAAINPGNSGGPLLDSSGRLIGVNTQIYSPSGASAGIGFSIPVDVVNWVVPDLIEFGEIRRPILGVELVSTSNTNRMGLEGALIMHVSPKGGAAEAGLRATTRNRRGQVVLGDLIVGINDEEITSNNDLILALENYQPGDVVQVKYIRDDEVVQRSVTLGEMQ